MTHLFPELMTKDHLAKDDMTMRIGEIIETGTTGFVAESLELNRPPALGSLVKVEVGDGTAFTAWSATAPRLVWIPAAAPCGAAPRRSTTSTRI